jgi:hypothetical protein
MGGECGTYERRLHVGFCWGDHLEYIRVDERIILKWILKKLDGEAWAGVNWLTIGTAGGLL